eukprot:gb/GEZN01018715.1/.p1 GENE.gb/GEZN01018715.1/~~gb/GEZN01018715.1/.p1  ORF type:complete len:148 (+),score=25.14 gb/GEZN01018715.1/:301-744(+)
MSEPELGEKDEEPDEDKDMKDVGSLFGDVRISPTKAQITESNGTIKVGLSFPDGKITAKVFLKRNVPAVEETFYVEAKQVILKVQKFDGYFVAKNGDDYLLFSSWSNVKTYFGKTKPEWVVSATVVGSGESEWLVNGKVVVSTGKKK